MRGLMINKCDEKRATGGYLRKWHRAKLRCRPHRENPADPGSTSRASRRDREVERAEHDGGFGAASKQQQGKVEHTFIAPGTWCDGKGLEPVLVAPIGAVLVFEVHHPSYPKPAIRRAMGAVS